MEYFGIDVRVIQLKQGMPALLAGVPGSVTTKSVEVGDVSVEPYQAGFQGQDAASGQDFGTVSFD